MKQVTLNIKDGKFKFFLELLKNLDFVEVVKKSQESTKEDQGDSDEEIVENIKRGLDEVQLIKEGKLKSRSATALLDELQN